VTSGSGLESIALSLSRAVIALSREGLAQSMPGASETEIGLRFVALHYGAALADAVRADLASRRG
jgi:hypothetical protein